jgi:PqqD family protein of HPr-rel-A system
VSDRHPKARETLTVVELDGEAVVFDPDSLDVHRLNPTATLIFRFLDGSSSVDELADDVAAAFDAPVDDVRAQLTELVQQLDETDLLEPA